MDRKVSPINAGLACDPAGLRVALRADFDVYASPISIERAFFEAGPKDLLVGKEWAMLVDANVLTLGAEERMKASLENRANMRILSDPDATWDAAETTLRIGAGVVCWGLAQASSTTSIWTSTSAWTPASVSRRLTTGHALPDQQSENEC